jgi:hypothetical protein
VIDGELGRGHSLAAVLAGAVITEEQVAPVGAEHPAGDLDVGQEPDDDHVLTKATPFHCLLDRLPGNIVNKGDALLGEQDHEPPLSDDVQRLK